MNQQFRLDNSAVLSSNCSPNRVNNILIPSVSLRDDLNNRPLILKNYSPIASHRQNYQPTCYQKRQISPISADVFEIGTSSTNSTITKISSLESESLLSPFRLPNLTSTKVLRLPLVEQRNNLNNQQIKEVTGESGESKSRSNTKTSQIRSNAASPQNNANIKLKSNTNIIMRLPSGENTNIGAHSRKEVFTNNYLTTTTIPTNNLFFRRSSPSPTHSNRKIGGLLQSSTLASINNNLTNSNSQMIRSVLLSSQLEENNVEGEGVVPNQNSLVKENTRALMVLQDPLHKSIKLINFEQSNAKYSRNSQLQITPVSMRVTVGKGNNSEMIKSVCRMRWWYHISDSALNLVESIYDLAQQQQQQYLAQQIIQSQQSPKSQQLEQNIHSNISTLSQRLNIPQIPNKSELDIKLPSSVDSELSQLNPGETSLHNEQATSTVIEFVWTQSRVTDLLAKMPSIQSNSSEIHPKNTNQIKNLEENKMNPGTVIDEISQENAQKTIVIHNHFEGNFELANKKNLFYNLRQYFSLRKTPNMLFKRIPLTFHVMVANKQDPAFAQFMHMFRKISTRNSNSNSTSSSQPSATTTTPPATAQQKNSASSTSSSSPKSGTPNNNNNNNLQTGTNMKSSNNNNNNNNGNNCSRQSKNIWIVKPAENSNRGRGIFVSRDIREIKRYINNDSRNYLGSNDKNSQQQQQQQRTDKLQHEKHTYIIQKYIENPLLYAKRKVDVRCYILLSNFESGHLKAYWYRDGYIRTSSKEFSTKSLKDQFIHLTNDAIQKQQKDYGRFEQANKLSYAEFDRYLESNPTSSMKRDKSFSFTGSIVPQMKEYALDCIRSVATKIDPNRKEYCFELFGLDFMMDDSLKLWLIEANANPCIETGCALLNKIIPPLIHNTFKIVGDRFCQNPKEWTQEQCVHFEKNYLQGTDKFECIFNEKKDGTAIRELYGKSQQSATIGFK